MAHPSRYDWRPYLGSAVSTAWHSGLTIAVALATTLITNHLIRPSIDISFEPTAPMVVTPDRRPTYGNYLYSIKVKTNGTFKNAIARLLIISNNPDLSDPLNTIVQPAFGWPLGEESFGPRTIGFQDYIIVASQQKQVDGLDHVIFFFNKFYHHPGPEKSSLAEIDFLKDLEPGVYYMQIGLIADDIVPVKKTFRIDWNRASGFKMIAID
jgi:hypothetical protein